MKEELVTARLVNATMKRYDALLEARGSKSDEGKKIAARARLRSAERKLDQACENYKKSGCQP